MGIITIEDVVEAVVGEVEAGYAFEEPLAREQRRYEVLEDGTYLMDARRFIVEEATERTIKRVRVELDRPGRATED